MIVSVIELHKNSSRDVEGYLVDEKAMDLYSDQFLKYMDEFHVKQKYPRRKVSWSGIVQKRDGGALFRTEAYFNGWVRDQVTGKQEMCHIIIEFPV